MLQVALATRAHADLKNLPPDPHDTAVLALRGLPVAFGRPHMHVGLGIRQLRHGIYEFRVGLSLRAIFVRFGNVIEIQMIGNHDEVRKYLRRR
jgi:hypothetical protein